MLTSLFHLQVLLPYVPEQSGVKTNFTLKSQNGCFQWYTVTCTHTQLLAIAHIVSVFVCTCMCFVFVGSVQSLMLPW